MMGGLGVVVWEIRGVLLRCGMERFAALHRQLLIAPLLRLSSEDKRESKITNIYLSVHVFTCYSSQFTMT